MIYSSASNDIIFFDEQQARPRHFKMYNNITLEMNGSRVEQIISTNPEDYTKYGCLVGKSLINRTVL